VTLDFKYEKEEYVDSRRKFLFMRGIITKIHCLITSLNTSKRNISSR
jgi:hypothetical protein